MERDIEHVTFMVVSSGSSSRGRRVFDVDINALPINMCRVDAFWVMHLPSQYKIQIKWNEQVIITTDDKIDACLGVLPSCRRIALGPLRRAAWARLMFQVQVEIPADTEKEVILQVTGEYDHDEFMSGGPSTFDAPFEQYEMHPITNGGGRLKLPFCTTDVMVQCKDVCSITLDQQAQDLDEASVITPYRLHRKSMPDTYYLLPTRESEQLTIRLKEFNQQPHAESSGVVLFIRKNALRFVEGFCCLQCNV